MSDAEEYEPGDVNAVSGYEPGDVNTRSADEVDDDDFDDELEDDLHGHEDGEGSDDVGDGVVGGDEDDDVDDDDVDDDDGSSDDANRVRSSMPESVLRYVARSLADEPDAVNIETDEHRGSVMLRLRVAPGDMGRVIGRRGRTAQAIRTLIGVAGARQGIQTRVDIVDD
jgi:uncharacterized protein